MKELKKYRFHKPLSVSKEISDSLSGNFDEFISVADAREIFTAIVGELERERQKYAGGVTCTQLIAEAALTDLNKCE